MLQTPERHKILAAAAARMAENLEACARNPRLAEWERARYAELARVERLHQAYHEEAAKLREQGLTPPDWIEMSGAFTRQGKADPNGTSTQDPQEDTLELGKGARFYIAQE